MGKFGIAERACGVSIILLVDILVSTKMSVEQVYLLPDRGSTVRLGRAPPRARYYGNQFGNGANCKTIGQIDLASDSPTNNYVFAVL